MTTNTDLEAQLSAIIEAFDGHIYICSPDYRIEFMNEKLIERTGHDGTGELCYKVLHERDDVCPWCVNERVFKGETVRWETKSPKDNRWYYIVNTPLYKTDGSVSKQALILDITSYKELQEDLTRERERYKAIVENQSELICRFDAGKALNFVNNSMCRFHKRERDSLIGTNFLDLISDEDRRKTEMMIDSLNREKSVIMVEAGASREEKKIWQQWVVRSLFDESGAFIEYQAVGRDISVQKNSEISLNNVRRDLEQQVNDRTASLTQIIGWLNESIIANNRNVEKLGLLESSLDLIDRIVMITDATGRVEYVNKKFTEVSGYSYAEIMGASSLDLGYQSETESEAMWNELRDKGCWEGRFSNHGKDGAPYFEEARIEAVTVKNSNSETLHYIKIADLLPA